MNEMTLPLTDLAAELNRHFGHPGPGYRAAYLAALDGRLPTVRIKGRHHVTRDIKGLREIAKVLGMRIADAPQGQRAPADKVAA